MINVSRPTRFTGILLGMVFCLATALGAMAQNRQAIVIMRPASTSAGEAVCDGSVDMTYHIINDPKLNDQDEVVMLNGVESTTGDMLRITRQSYESAPEMKLKTLAKLAWSKENVFAAVLRGSENSVPVLPGNLKPAKNSAMPLNSFYSVMLTGEEREGKSKRKASYGLREIWKVYFVPDGSTVGDVLFAHAAEEKSVAVWEAFLRKTSNYRGGEANSQMRDALLGCAQRHLDEFQNGRYTAIEDARKKVERAQAVRSDEMSQQLLARVAQEKQKVDDTRLQVEQLLGQNRYDDAVNAAEPIKVYLGSWAELNKSYTAALKASHDLHLDKGEKALLSSQLEVALNECETAWKRQRDSAGARACVCQSRTRIVLRDADNLLKQKKPKAAKELLEKQIADSDCVRDLNVADKLTGAKCEYGKQLLSEARLLVGGSPSIATAPVVTPAKATRKAPATGARTPVSSAGTKGVTPVNKAAFREARGKLIEAQGLCESEEARNLLDSTNQKLADYAYSRATIALKSGNYGTAYVLLQAAQKYAPNDMRVNEALGSARNEFDEKIRVNIGIVFNNKSGINTGDQALEQVKGAVESIAADVGLSQPTVLDQREAINALNQIRNQSTPTAIFTFNLTNFAFVKSENPHNVPSTYSYPNQQWKDADMEHDNVKRDWENCKKTSGEAACTGLRTQVERLKANRDRYPHDIVQNYYYRENIIQIRGNVRMTYFLNDSITGSVKSSDLLESSVAEQCVERQGVNPQDRSGARDQFCDLSDGSTYLERMINDVRTQSISAASGQLRAMPLGYYNLAKTSADKNVAAEKYIRYMFLTGQKSSAEAQDARKRLLDIDPELDTDGELR
jgi:hypothetical protein